MLDSGRKRSYADSKVVTIIGPGTSITGEIHSKGTVRVEGAVAGRVQSDDAIVIQETGRVKAELVGAQIVISGRVEGNVIAQERLEVTAGGQIVGDITAPRVAIADGVLFEGKCIMRPPGESAQAQSTPADGQRENKPEAKSRL